MQDVLFRFRINFNKIEVANFIFNNGNQRDKKITWRNSNTIATQVKIRYCLQQNLKTNH